MSKLPFPQNLDISKRSFFLFTVCNSAEYFYEKQSFYQLKSRLLRKYGKQDGYDLQIIDRHCYSCEGTGIYMRYGHKTGRTCNSCGGSGIYMTKQIALRRFILNDQVFHEPAPEISTSDLLFHSKIKGLIKHEKPDYNATYAYAELLLIFEPDKFTIFLKGIGDRLATRSKHRFRAIMRKSKSYLDGLADYLGFVPKQMEEDLPF